MNNLIFLAAFTLFLTSSARAQDSVYGGDPLQLGAGARALGMGSAFVAVSDDATAFYWNPAGLVYLVRREVHAQHTQQFGGSVNHDILALGLPLKMGGLGLGLQRIGVDDISFTALEDPGRPIGPDNRPIVSRTVGTTEFDLHLAYAHRLRPFLTVGFSTKLVYRNLSVGTGSGFGIDAGLMYQPRLPLKFGLVIRDLTRTRIHFDTGKVDVISPSFLLGSSYQFPLSETNTLLASTSLQLAQDRSGIENDPAFGVGLEYQFRQKVMLRLGRQGSHLTAGAGIRLARATVDLAYLENNQLNNTYRISTSLYF
ncbi:MAG: PorV/PorQ family protein [bacterium]|nr:PorV/PorQ family protein [bacterium]